MGAILHGGGKTTATTYGQFSLAGGTLIPTATEANVLRTSQVAGAVSQFGASVDAQGTGRSITFRKNSGAGASTVSFTDSTQQVVYDTTHTDALIATDTFDVIYNGAGAATLPYFVKYVFTATSGHVSYQFSALINTGTGTIFYALNAGVSTTEANQQNTMRAAGTLSNVAVNVTVASTSTATLVTRINGASGTISVSITANTTGVFVDNTHTDAFTAGQTVGYQVTGQSSALFAGPSAIITWAASSNDILAGAGNSISFSASNQFVRILGSGVPLGSEAEYKLQHGFAGGSSNMRWYVGTNTLGGTATVNLRKNGADANQTFDIGATLTGLFEDSTNNDNFLATDDICYRFSGGVSGALTPRYSALTEGPVVSGDTLLGQACL